MAVFRKESSLPPTSDAAAIAPDPAMCPFCGRHCRVALARSMPPAVVKAYEAARVYSMAMCEEGAAAEHLKFGASYADVIVARVQLVRGMADSR